MRPFVTIRLLAIAAMLGVTPAMPAAPPDPAAAPDASTGASSSTAAPASGAAAASPLSSSRIGRRIVKEFDFDERRLGNFESMPMNWRRLVAPQFPRYLDQKLDDGVGHDAAPSFRIGLLAGNAAASYEGDQIPIHPASDYRVSCWIKPDRLASARAYVSAFYRDSDMRPIPGAERRTELVGRAGSDQWTEVSLILPGGNAQARWIGLSLWLVQPDQLDDASRPTPGPRAIRTMDVHGGAWFDDIRVTRLPRLTVDLGRGCALFKNDEPIRLSMRLSDPDAADLDAALTLHDEFGDVLRRIPLDLRGSPESRQIVDLSDTPPGWRRAATEVSADGHVLARNETRFVRLSDSPVIAAGRGAVGLLLDPGVKSDWPAARDMLRAASASAVKLPVWTSAVTPTELVEGDRAFDAMMRDLRADGVDVVALLSEPPAALAAQYAPAQRSLLDVLSSPPDVWRPYLALPVARLGGLVRAWQIGADSDLIRADPRRRGSIFQSQAELGRLVQPPTTAAPWSLSYELPQGELPVRFASLSVPPLVSPARIPAHLASFADGGFGGLWAVIEPIDSARFGPRMMLADLARRLVLAKAGGAELLFIQQPWSSGAAGGDTLLPDVTLPIARTLGRALRGVTRARNLSHNPDQSEWLLSRDDGGAVLIAWRESADGPDAPISIDVGAGVRQIDLFGRPVPPPPAAPGDDSSDAARRIQAPRMVGYMPTLFIADDAAALETRASIRLAEGVLAPAPDPRPNAVIIRNSRGQALHGRLEIASPAGWRIEPEALAVFVPAGGEERFPITIRVPTHAASESLLLDAKLAVEAEPRETIQVRMPVRVGVADLDVKVLLQADGDRLFVRQRMTNQSKEALNFECFALAPGRARLTRLVRGLQPGETIERVFELADPAKLRGRSIRVGLEQIGGPRRINQLIDVPE